MEPILSKEEISELLSAIKDGRINVDAAAGDATPSHRLVPAVDIDLFQTFERKSGTVEARIPNFDLILDALARMFSSSLTNQLQRTFLVEREEITVLSFEESLRSLANQGAVGVYSTEPLKHGCLSQFDAALSFTLLEIMLGAPPISDSLSPERALTSIEMSVLRQTMQSFGDDLQRAFKQVALIRPALIKVENNFRLLNIVEEDAEVLMTTFNLKVGGQQAGRMRFIIPYLTVEPLKEAFREIVSVVQTTTGWSKLIAREALGMDVLVIARSGLLDMSVRQILSLRAGDIVDLGYDPERPLSVVVEDQPKFSGIPGERNGRKAIHILSTQATG